MKKSTCIHLHTKVMQKYKEIVVFNFTTIIANHSYNYYSKNAIIIATMASLPIPL